MRNILRSISMQTVHVELKPMGRGLRRGIQFTVSNSRGPEELKSHTRKNLKLKCQRQGHTKTRARL